MTCNSLKQGWLLVPIFDFSKCAVSVAALWTLILALTGCFVLWISQRIRRHSKGVCTDTPDVWKSWLSSIVGNRVEVEAIHVQWIKFGGFCANVFHAISTVCLRESGQQWDSVQQTLCYIYTAFWKILVKIFNCFKGF